MSGEKVLEFLKHGNKIPEDRKKFIRDHMGNWVKFSRIISKLTDQECCFVVLEETSRQLPRNEFVFRPLRRILRNEMIAKIQSVEKYLDDRVFG